MAPQAIDPLQSKGKYSKPDKISNQLKILDFRKVFKNQY